ncbi:MAG: hypothetical protein K0R46_1530, partial [Herbinix sp.]|nr:hypothetical protein [Herbinix sp.]
SEEKLISVHHADKKQHYWQEKESVNPNIKIERGVNVE